MINSFEILNWIGEFRFASPWYLLLLLLIPVWIVVLKIKKKGRSEGTLRYSDVRNLKKVPRSWKLKFRPLLNALRFAALALLIVAMARPQSGWTERNVKSEGIDIMLALDVSQSMSATDFRPNRLEAAKRVIAEFVEGREADRIGCVLFASTAFTLCPLTLDYDVIKGFLENADFGIIDGNRTAIGLGLATCVKKLKDSEARSKVVILLTDGENNVWDIAPETAAETAEALDIRVYTIGVGSEGTAMVPVDMGPMGIVKRPMQVRIDEETLKQIADATGGKYFRATNDQKLMEIYREIDKMETSKIEVVEHQYYDELMQAFAWPGLVLLLLEIIMRGTVFLKTP